MSQVTMYLPAALAASLRREAKRAGKSLSAHVADLATARKDKSEGWPDAFKRLYGACDGELTAGDGRAAGEPRAE